MDRRKFLASAIAGTVGLAGCLQGGDGAESPEPKETETPTDGSLSWKEASNTPNPDLPITAENYHDETHTVSVVVSQDGTTVHEATVELEPGVELEVFNLEETDPDGIEAFEITATIDGRTESVGVETNACYGGVYVWIQEDGEFVVTYSIC